MKFKNKENEKITSTDGRDFWISRSVAVCGTIIGIKNIEAQEAFVLVEKRGSSLDSAGKWCLPCGYLDWDETGPEAIKREIFEECNLNIDKLVSKQTKCFNCLNTEWRVNTDPDSNRQNVTLHYGLIFFTDGKELPKVKSLNTEEVEMVGWQSLELLHTLDWAFDHNVIINRFQSHFMNKTLGI